MPVLVLSPGLVLHAGPILLLVIFLDEIVVPADHLNVVRRIVVIGILFGIWLLRRILIIIFNGRRLDHATAPLMVLASREE
jgi:hypothetical protein